MHSSTVEIYRLPDGQTEVDVRFDSDTVWLSQAQMVQLFGRDQSVVSRHVRNAIKDGEIIEESNMQKMHIAHADHPVTFYTSRSHAPAWECIPCSFGE